MLPVEEISVLELIHNEYDKETIKKITNLSDNEIDEIIKNKEVSIKKCIEESKHLNINAFDELVKILDKHNKLLIDIDELFIHVNPHRNIYCDIFADFPEYIITSVDQINMLKYVDYNFRPGVQVIEGEILLKDKSFLIRESQNGFEKWVYFSPELIREEIRKKKSML